MGLLGGARKLVRSLPLGPRFVHRLRRAAAAGFQAGAFIRYGIGRRATPLRQGPIAVVGFHNSVLGLGEAARSFSAALRAADIPVVDWDISSLFGHERRLSSGASTEPPSEACSLVIYLNPRELIQLVAMTGARPFAGRFCVGHWAWELERAPANWGAALRYVDEVWAPTQFVADAVTALARGRTAVRIAPYPMRPRDPSPGARARFAIAEDQTVVLTAFDLRSGFVRKNPIGAVRAFRAAAAHAKVPALMICKATGAEGAPEQFAQLQAEIGEARDVRLVTDWLSAADMAALISAADIVLSMHRSEGFGLVMAQGLCAAKAVIATGWSANLDFIIPANSMLIDYSLIPVKDPQELYGQGRWAEPDMEDAVAKLATLIADPELRRRLGERGQADIAALLDPMRLARQAAAWLGQDAA